jgi:hypothetical protein
MHLLTTQDNAYSAQPFHAGSFFTASWSGEEQQPPIGAQLHFKRRLEALEKRGCPLSGF